MELAGSPAPEHIVNVFIYPVYFAALMKCRRLCDNIALKIYKP